MIRMASDEGKTAGWPIPAKVKEEFTDFCKEVGSLAKDDMDSLRIVDFERAYQINRLRQLLLKCPSWYCEGLADEIERILPQIQAINHSTEPEPSPCP